MSRYELRSSGVWDNVAHVLILPGDPGWEDYLAYRIRDGEVDAAPAIVAPIETRRDVVSGKIDRYSRESLLRPFSVGGNDYSLSFDEQEFVTYAALAEAAGLTIPVPFTLYADSGALVATTPNNRRNLAERIIARRHRLYLRRRALIAEIATSSDPELIDVGSGWDGP